MRVLFPIERVGVEGGMQRSTRLLIKYLADTKLVECAVMLPDNGPAVDFYGQAGATIYISQKLKNWPLNVGNPVQSLTGLYKFRSELDKVIQDFQPSVINTNHLPAEIYVGIASLGRKNFPRRVFTQRGNEYSGISCHVLKWVLKSADKCVVTTEYQKQVTQKFLGVPGSKIKLIPNCTEVHLQPDNDRTYRKKWGVKDNELLFGMIGSICPNKAQMTLLRAAAMCKDSLPNAKYAFIGKRSRVTPKYLDELEALIESLSMRDRVILPGFIEDVAGVMRSLDVVVSASLKEGFGRTIIESWAAGKPVITSDAAGPKCLVHNDVDALIFTTENYEQLAQQLVLMKDQSLRNRLGDAGYNNVLNQYDPREVARKYMQVYKEITHNIDGVSDVTR
jgi:glycosyltransferase involved in cell wall biosynthesis